MSDLIVYNVDAFKKCLDAHNTMKATNNVNMGDYIIKNVDRINYILDTFMCFKEVLEPIGAKDTHIKTRIRPPNGYFKSGGGRLSTDQHGGRGFGRGSEFKNIYTDTRNNLERMERKDTRFPLGYDSRFTGFNSKNRTIVLKDSSSMVRSHLNKLTASNSKTIFSHVLMVCKDDAMHDSIMKLVFEKALTEPSYISLYVKLIGEMKKVYPNASSVALAIFDESVYTDLPLTLEGLRLILSATDDYDAFCSSQKIKNRLLNQNLLYIELILQRVTDNDIVRYFDHIMYLAKNFKEKENVTEIMVQCISEILKRFRFTHPKFKDQILELYKNELHIFSNSKTRFKIMDF